MITAPINVQLMHKLEYSDVYAPYRVKCAFSGRWNLPSDPTGWACKAFVHESENQTLGVTFKVVVKNHRIVSIEQTGMTE